MALLTAVRVGSDDKYDLREVIGVVFGIDDVIKGRACVAVRK